MKQPLKRALYCLPLLCLAPLGVFFPFYLEGRAMSKTDVGGSIGPTFFVFLFSMLVLPWTIAAVFASLPKLRWPIRVLLFVAALLVQFFVIFKFVPNGAASEMIGIAHGLKHDFPPEYLKGCANRLRKKFRAGTLRIAGTSNASAYSNSTDSITVADIELTDLPRGRFREVKIWKAADGSEDVVVFVMPNQIHIYCSSWTPENGELFHSVADGVYAFRYMRQ